MANLPSWDTPDPTPVLPASIATPASLNETGLPLLPGWIRADELIRNERAKLGNSAIAPAVCESSGRLIGDDHRVDEAGSEG